MQVNWTKRASDNLEKILAHIAQDNFIASKKFLSETRRKISNIETFPLFGRSGIVPDTRELVIHENYILYYRVQNGKVNILRVLHVKRKYP
jgi:toxin ParE1/3/4